MSAKSFQLLLETAYDTRTPPVFEEGATAVYETFEKTYKASRLGRDRSADELNFRFERLRLGVAIAFVKALTRLADNEKSLEALQLLQEAIRARSTKEIDKIIQKKITAFDQLYHEIFVNEQREQVLALFEQTLDAGSKEELDELIMEGLELLQEVDWNAHRQEQDDDDDIEPLDELLKNL